MSLKNLAAYTPPSGQYPPYLSINQHESGNVSFTVRSPRNETTQQCGDTANIEVSAEQALELLEKAIATLKASTQAL